MEIKIEYIRIMGVFVESVSIISKSIMSDVPAVMAEHDITLEMQTETNMQLEFEKIQLMNIVPVIKFIYSRISSKDLSFRYVFEKNI